MANSISYAGAVVPDCFVGVPYLAGIPLYGGSAALSICSVEAGALPPGLSVAGSAKPYLTGTVLPTSSTGTQVDGSYSFTIVSGDSNGNASQAFSVNVHYLTNDQDLSVAAQASLRAGEDIFNTQVEDVGVLTNLFPTAPVIPTDVG